MEAHLQALASSLQSIHDLHARTAYGRHGSSSSYTGSSSSNAAAGPPPSSLPTLGRQHFPFTKAILNSDDKDILDFIRDANHLETSLFWYPPAAPSQADAAAVGRDGNRKRSAMPASGAAGTGGKDAPPAASLDDLSAVRAAPALRQAAPPTPLKATSKDLEAAGKLVWESRTLLLTAQRLAQGEEKFTRTKKHVKEMIKKSGEVEKARKRFEEKSTQMQEAIKLGPEGHRRKLEEETKKAKANSVAATSGKGSLGQQELSKKIKALKQELQQEEMEIFALEEMKTELQSKHNALSSKARQRKSLPSATAGDDSQEGDDASFTRDGDIEVARQDKNEEDEFLGDVSAPLGVGSSKAAQDLEDEDVTIRKSNSAGVAGEEAQLAGKTAAADEEEDDEEDEDDVPEPTDELERVTEKVWTVFGDVIRYIAPERESADFVDTLKMLEVLVGSRPASALHSILGTGGATAVIQPPGDSSVVSTGTATSGATGASATSAGSSSATLLNAGPPSPTHLSAAHILISLLRTPEPHQLEFEDLKILTGNWWETEGRERCRKMLSDEASKRPEDDVLGPNEQAELTQQGETLAARAVYGLQAKKLLMIRRKGAKAPVGFAGL